MTQQTPHHPVQQAYLDAKREHERIEAQTLAQLEETGMLAAAQPDFDAIASKQVDIMQSLGERAAREKLARTERALKETAYAWILKWGTSGHAEAFESLKDRPDCQEKLLDICASLPMKAGFEPEPATGEAEVREFPALEDLPEDWGEEYCKSASVEPNGEYEAWLGWKNTPRAEDY